MQINIDQYCFFDSPIGRILLAGANGTLLLLSMPEGKNARKPEKHWRYDAAPFQNVIQQLSEYFAGKRQEFSVDYHIQGTEFKQQALKAVAKVPYGKTAAYGQIAQKIKNPLAVRAVGGANATNPIPIIVPCHRIIGKNGSLTGFGGGMAAKRFLLELEGVTVPA